MSNDRKTSNNQKSGLRLFMLLCVFIALIGAGIVKAIEANAESIAPANVEYYVLIDNEWTRIATDEVNDMRGFGNKSRYYTTASHLKEIYKNYGFDASIYNGEMIFPHTDYMDPNTIWADTAPELEDNTWKIPLSHRTRSYVYYLPNNVKGNNPYYTTSVSKEDETLKSTNTFYTVSVSDPRRTLTNLPETQYILTGHSVSLTLPILSQGNWLAYNCDTDEVIEPDDYITSKNEMKITFDHVTSPIKVVTSTLENPEYTLRFNTNTVNGCLTQIGEIAASQQQVEETMTILGNTSYEDVYESDREDVYTVFEPDSKRCLVSIKGSSKMKKYYYVFQGWKVGNSNKIIPANQQLERKDIARFEHNGILELNAMWSALDTNSRITSTNFYLSLDCEVSDNTSNGFGKVDEKNFTSSLYTTSLKGTENIPIASNGDWNYSLVDAATSAQEAYEKDAQIHSMVTTPIKGVTADTMPSDEEILEQLRNSNADIKVDDQSVDKDELTTDHFKIRWYAVKYVKEDGWHVDGVLVAKEGYLVVKKTFSGDSQAIDQIKRNYSISVQRTTTTENNTIYNLNLSQESDDNTSGYKYYDKKTDTYTWVLKVRPGSQYILKENNYMVDNTWYHSNRYMITNSSDATDTWQDYNDTGVEVTASSYPNDINYTSYQTVSFYNTYVQAGFITFIKEDAFSKQGLENVSFILTDQSNKSITIYKKGEQYSTEAKSLNEGYVKTDKLVTNSKGEIQLKISQGKYRLVENVPVGYEGVKKIDFSIDANGKISESKAYNEENQEVINQIETTESMCMIKNTSKQLTTVTAQGEWKASEDNKLPMTVELWCNGSKLVGNQYTQELNNENEWKYTWNDLPLYVNGSVATYTLRVVKVGNVAYDSASDQDGYRDYKITVDPTKYREGNEGEYNSDPSWLDENGIWHFSNHALVKVHCQPDFTVGDIPIVINWKDSKNEDGLRPESITVWLVKEGVRTANSIELSEENGWTGSFKNVRLQENKVEYHYSIDFDRFDNIDYYQTTITGNQIEGFDITNTYQPQKTTVSGKINWQGDEDDLKARPTSVKVILYGDGKEIAQKVVGEEDQWTYSFDDLLVLNKGKIINYTVKQETITDYTTSIEGFNITNVYTPEKILIAGRVQWNDEQDYKGARPDKAHLILYANGKEIAQMDVDATSQWRYQFGSFPIRSNGKEIKYTIKEKNVQDYSTIIEDYTVINNYHPETTTVSGMIKWKDDEKYLQNRPSNIKVILYANGKKQLEKEVYVNNEGNWKYIFENLPIRENKKDIIYTVQIESIQGYITTIEGYTILNEYMPMNNLKPSIEVPNSNKEEESFQENSIKTNTLEAKPHTGDDTNVSMYLILLLGSCHFALVVICLKKANQHK